jgi:hypothetical protein
VTRLLHVVLAPGAWLTGIPIPDAAHIATIGGEGAGERAASWIHLYAATLLLVVILPRLVLAAAAWIGERRRLRTFPIPLGDPYYQRLLHTWREGTARVAVLPYSFDLPAASREGLAKLMARVFDAGVDVAWLPSTRYGDDTMPELPPPPLAGVAVAFSLAATPERENHGAFVEAQRTESAATRSPLIAIVDTTEFVDRFGGQPRRIAEREAAWRQLLEPLGVEPLFVRLVDPDLREAGVTLTDRLERAAS